ncbi:histidine phosphatase family protein [Candidatus Uhrbacteria bacterium]|nr:histidine phosphatase family protein [Candidatus Uhrbacteria bacterium]
MWPERIIFVRHAESQGNTMTADERADCSRGTNLYELTAIGRRQAEITGAWLRERFSEPDGFYTSYYTRTGQTAALLYPDRTPYVDERLAEAQRGIWHIRPRLWIEHHMPWEIDARKRAGDYHYRPPGGESWPDIELRIRSFNHTIHRRYAGKTLVLVVHGHWLLLWRKIAHHWTIDDAVSSYARRGPHALAANASVTIYRGVGDEHGRHIIVPDPDQPYVVPWEGQLDATSTIS